MFTECVHGAQLFCGNRSRCNCAPLSNQISIVHGQTRRAQHDRTQFDNSQDAYVKFSLSRARALTLSQHSRFRKTFSTDRIKPEAEWISLAASSALCTHGNYAVKLRFRTRCLTLRRSSMNQVCSRSSINRPNRMLSEHNIFFPY